jgi:membrane protein DedA with SNARE-associated domain
MLELLTSHYYWSIFIGMFFFGDLAVVPAIYLGVTGKLDFSTIAWFTFFANLASDIIWYYIGQIIPQEKIKNSFLFKSKKDEFDNPSPYFKLHGMKILFYSKFVYGIRPLVRVLCGIYKLSFAEYMGINIVTTALWIGLVTVGAKFFNTSLESLKHVVLGGEIVFTIFIICFFVFELWAKKYFKKKWGSR